MNFYNYASCMYAGPFLGGGLNYNIIVRYQSRDLRILETGRPEVVVS